MIALTEVSKSYGAAPALENVHLALPATGVVAIAGSNGSGKTTLLLILAGLLPPTEGHVHRGRPATSVAYLPDHADFEPWLTSEEIVRMGLSLGGNHSAPADGFLTRLALTPKRSSSLGSLSRGWRQRVALSATLARDATVSLLDEPFAGLDGDGLADSERWIRDLAGDRLIAYSTSDLVQALRFSDEIALLSSGKLIFFGPTTELHDRLSRSTVILVRVATDAQNVVQGFRREAWVIEAEMQAEGEIRLRVNSSAEAAVAIPRVLHTLAAPLEALTPVDSDLTEAIRLMSE